MSRIAQALRQPQGAHSELQLCSLAGRMQNPPCDGFAQGSFQPCSHALHSGQQEGCEGSQAYTPCVGAVLGAVAGGREAGRVCSGNSELLLSAWEMKGWLKVPEHLGPRQSSSKCALWPHMLSLLGSDPRLHVAGPRVRNEYWLIPKASFEKPGYGVEERKHL